MTGILDGVRVLDLSSGIAGPITAMLLSDHGADVVRVEAPDRGPDRPGEVVWHRGTRRVEIDVTAPDGRDAVLDLATRADVVLESLRPADAVALGLRARRPARRQPPPRAHVDHRLRTRRPGGRPARHRMARHRPHRAAGRPARLVRHPDGPHHGRRPRRTWLRRARRRRPARLPGRPDLPRRAVGQPRRRAAGDDRDQRRAVRRRAHRRRPARRDVARPGRHQHERDGVATGRHDAPELPPVVLRPAGAEGHLPRRRR